MSQKRKSDVSCSVAGANLRRKRRRIVGDDPVNPSTATDGEMKRTEVFEYFGNPEKLTLEQGQVVMERRLKELDLTQSPSQKVTPADGSCLFHSLLDQTRYIPDLNDIASSSTEFRTNQSGLLKLHPEQQVDLVLRSLPRNSSGMERENAPGWSVWRRGCSESCK